MLPLPAGVILVIEEHSNRELLISSLLLSMKIFYKSLSIHLAIPIQSNIAIKLNRYINNSSIYVRLFMHPFFAFVQPVD